MTKRFLWLLDAGHAPNTHGKRSPVFYDGSRFHEWIFNRKVVDLIALGLEARGIAYHVLTPRTDHDVTVVKRADLANFVARHTPSPCRLVSVHANAHRNEWTDAGGTVTLHSGLSAESRAMADVFQRAMVRNIGFRNRGILERPRLVMLRRTSMPAVITECGFYTNPEEAAVLSSAAGQAVVAAAHIAAIAQLEGIES